MDKTIESQIILLRLYDALGIKPIIKNYYKTLEEGRKNVEEAGLEPVITEIGGKLKLISDMFSPINIGFKNPQENDFLVKELLGVIEQLRSVRK